MYPAKSTTSRSRFFQGQGNSVGYDWSKLHFRLIVGPPYKSPDLFFRNDSKLTIIFEYFWGFWYFRKAEIGGKFRFVGGHKDESNLEGLPISGILSVSSSSYGEVGVKYVYDITY